MVRFESVFCISVPLLNYSTFLPENSPLLFFAASTGLLEVSFVMGGVGLQPQQAANAQQDPQKTRTLLTRRSIFLPFRVDSCQKPESELTRTIRYTQRAVGSIEEISHRTPSTLKKIFVFFVRASAPQFGTESGGTSKCMSELNHASPEFSLG